MNNSQRMYTLIFVFVALMICGVPSPLANDALLGNIDEDDINPSNTSVPGSLPIFLLGMGIVGLAGVARAYRKD
jgi:hypothetical protein